MWIRTLTGPECIEVVAANRLARLACANEGKPYVVPLYYSYAENHLYAFSLPGKKITLMRLNPLVSAVVDVGGAGPIWRSVVIDGHYEELPDRMGHKLQRERALSLLSQHAGWWEPGGLKPVLPLESGSTPYVFFRISVDQLSGREAKDGDGASAECDTPDAVCDAR